MAITAYCGVMGSGKSYEVVSGPVLDAVTVGRRVVTNVDGINEQVIHAYLMAKRGVPAARLGSIIHVRTDDLKREAFFPVEVESGAGASVVPGFVQPGDLVVVDEAWKLWATGEKVSKEHMAFFRMHRHFVHAETGVACDVILMIQSIGDLHRSIRSVVELSFRMVKLKSLGLSKGYRVEMYETGKQARSTLTGTFVRYYKSEIFPLYKSYAGQGGSGQEATVDKRQNVLTNPMLWVIVVLALCSGVVGVWWTWRFFHGHGVGPSRSNVAHAGDASKGVSAAAGGGAGAGGGGASGAGGGFGSAHAPGMSSSWRVAGSYVAGGRGWVVLVDGNSRLRVEAPADFVGAGVSRVGVVDGERVSSWSGSVPSKGLAGLGGVK